MITCTLTLFKLKKGVKQGDRLRPTLFNYFINDLHSVFDNTCDPVHLNNTSISSLCFADDLVILSKSQAGLQNSFNKLEKYCYKWQLTVNTNFSKLNLSTNNYLSQLLP